MSALLLPLLESRLREAQRSLDMASEHARILSGLRTYDSEYASVRELDIACAEIERDAWQACVTKIEDAIARARPPYLKEGA